MNTPLDDAAYVDCPACLGRGGECPRCAGQGEVTMDTLTDDERAAIQGRLLKLLDLFSPDYTD